MSFLPAFQSDFYSLAEQFRKGEPTHVIMKNVACSIKGDVRLLTIGSSILAPVHSNTLKSKLTAVFNTHIKNQGQVVARKVMTLFYLIILLLLLILQIMYKYHSLIAESTQNNSKNRCIKVCNIIAIFCRI